MVPGIARPVTIVAMIGVATSAAPGNAVFDMPTISAAIRPEDQVAHREHRRSLGGRSQRLPVSTYGEIVDAAQVRCSGMRRYTPCVL